MDILHFENFKELAIDIVRSFNNIANEFGDVSIIAKYEEAKEIVKELICFGYSLESIYLCRDELNYYADEYLVSVNLDGLWCEPFKRKNQYLMDDSSVTYLLDNCSSACIPHCLANEIYEVSIGEEAADECDCCKELESLKKYVEFSKDNDGDMHGFSASRSNGDSYCSMSFYSTEKLSLREIQNLLQENGF